jgi:DNA mismatch repair protein MutS2
MGLESVIARLEARDAELAHKSERLADAEAAATATAEAQQASAAALARRERELGHAAREAVEAAIAETRAELAAIVRRAQATGSARAAEEGRAELARVAAEALARLPGAKKPVALAGALAVGARVRVERLGIDGVLVQAPDAHGRAKVRAGNMTVDVGGDELAPSTAPRPETRQRPRAGAGGVPAAKGDDLALVSVTGARTVDLRGQTGDDALSAVEAALDRATLEGHSYLILIHGHGTGALRKRVRAYLTESHYVARWAPGSPQQGGDGVSVVELR